MTLHVHAHNNQTSMQAWHTASCTAKSQLGLILGHATIKTHCGSMAASQVPSCALLERDVHMVKRCGNITGGKQAYLQLKGSRYTAHKATAQRKLDGIQAWSCAVTGVPCLWHQELPSKAPVTFGGSCTGK